MKGALAWFKGQVVALRAVPPIGIAMLIGCALTLRMAISQLLSIPLPIFVGEGHHWRQTFTYSVAWNYAHSTLDVFHPRMFVELSKSNIIAMEAPVYPFVASFLLRLTGDSVIAMRAFSWLSLVAIVGVLFHWLGQGRKDQKDVLADRAALLIALGLSPLALVEFRAIQPDPVVAGLLMPAAYFFVRYRDSNEAKYAIRGALIAGLAVLTKSVGLAVMPALVLFAAWDDKKVVDYRRFAFATGLIVFALVPAFAWDRWARHLNATEMEGAFFIAITQDLKLIIANLKAPAYAREALLHLVPNYVVGYWLAPALITGMYRGLSDPALRRWALPMLAWFAGTITELLAVGDRIHSNAYYFTITIAPCLMFTAFGVGAFIRAAGSTDQRPGLTTFRVGLATGVLLVFSTTLGKRAIWSKTDVESLALLTNRNVWGEDLGVFRMLVVILAAIALGPRLRPTRVHPKVGALLVVLILCASEKGVRTSMQYFAFMRGEEGRGNFKNELAELRAQVDKVSKIDDRIIMAPGGPRGSPNMIFFYYPLRNGFPIYNDEPANMQITGARRPKLYLQIGTKAEIAAQYRAEGPIVGEGPWWRLRCVDPQGCTGR